MIAALVFAILIGLVAGLRAMTPPAAISWAAALGWLPLFDSSLAFMGYRWTPYIFTALAVVELITDQLPSTPSRKVPVQFATRLVMGGLTGACFSIGAGSTLVLGLICGVVGALIGTLGGAEARAKLASMFGKDLPAALIEDAVAIGLAALLVLTLS